MLYTEYFTLRDCFGFLQIVTYIIEKDTIYKILGSEL